MSDLIRRQDAIRLAEQGHIQGFVWQFKQLCTLPSAEPEIIHCKDCKHRDSNDCPMYYEEWIEIDEGDGYFDTDNIIHDRTTDEGFCHCAELRGKEE